MSVDIFEAQFNNSVGKDIIRDYHTQIYVLKTANLQDRVL